MMKLSIDRRSVETSVAVFLSVLVSRQFKLEYPFFAVIASIFTLENTLDNPYKAGVYRLIGTIVGAAVGIAFVLIQPGNALLSGIGTMVLILICSSFSWERAVPIAGVVFASIMLTIDRQNPFTYSFNRVISTFAGIVIAVAVSRLSNLIPDPRQNRK